MQSSRSVAQMQYVSHRVTIAKNSRCLRTNDVVVGIARSQWYPQSERILCHFNALRHTVLTVLLCECQRGFTAYISNMMQCKDGQEQLSYELYQSAEAADAALGGHSVRAVTADVRAAGLTGRYVTDPGYLRWTCRGTPLQHGLTPHNCLVERVARPVTRMCSSLALRCATMIARNGGM